jgi:opacity protein-like surface antigen
VAVNQLACRVLISFILSLSATPFFAQKIPEIGFNVGSSQYFGDLNPSNLLYKPSLSGGLSFIYNLSTRLGIKASITHYTIKGNGFLEYTNTQYEFSNSCVNYQAVLSTNFLDYNHNLKKDNFTPYFNLGIGFSRALQNNVNIGGASKTSYLTIPFGPGVKYLFKNKVTIGLEYVFNRSFTDHMDGQEIVNYGNYILQDQAQPPIDEAIINPSVGNKDWYSYLNLYITFKFINFDDDCPAYY